MQDAVWNKSTAVFFQTVKISVKREGHQTQSAICDACLLLQNTRGANGQTPMCTVPSSPERATEPLTASLDSRRICIF